VYALTGPNCAATSLGSDSLADFFLRSLPSPSISPDITDGSWILSCTFRKFRAYFDVLPEKKNLTIPLIQRYKVFITCSTTLFSYVKICRELIEFIDRNYSYDYLVFDEAR